MNESLRKTLKQVIPSWVVTNIRRVRSRARIKELMRGREVVYLEIGAGDKQGDNGWITLDMTRNCDIYWDLREGVPFPNESISKIYSSHLFEHLSFRDAQSLLQECLRVLLPGGLFSICVPNTRIYAEAYLNKKNLDEEQFFQHKVAYHNVSPIDYLNYVAYMDGEHKYMYDEDNLVSILEKNGFRNSRLRGFDPELDSYERDFESIYAEAQK
jgi:predicted SAM-dependent methyltransferase